MAVHTSMCDMALKLSQYFYLLTEKPLGLLSSLVSLSGGTVQPENAFLYAQGDRSSLKRPKRDKHQHKSKLTPEFIFLSQSQQI